MSEKEDSTPQPRRRLGLRPRNGANTTPGIRRQQKEENSTKEKGETDAVETPRGVPLKPKSNSTNCRRLGLSRQRKDLSKKKLEFALFSDAKEDKENPTEKKTHENPVGNKWTERKIVEVQADIEMWKNRFITAVEGLQAMVEGRVTKRAMFIQLDIPLELLEFLDED